MRKDIEIHINTKDVTIVPKNKVKFRPFKWVGTPTGGQVRYIYGEIEVPAQISERSIREKGISVQIPYTPKYKEFMLRVRRVYEDGSSVVLINEVDGSEWFLVTTGLYGSEQKNVFASELISIADGDFTLKFSNGTLQLYSAHQSDFNIIEVDRQNSNCLLACYPTNNYRYPVSGVGLGRWINANAANSKNMAKIIQREFYADGMTVKSAAFDFETKQMALEATETNPEE